jgi:hypothetical protein
LKLKEENDAKNLLSEFSEVLKKKIGAACSFDD